MTAVELAELLGRRGVTLPITRARYYELHRDASPFLRGAFENALQSIAASRKGSEARAIARRVLERAAAIDATLRELERETRAELTPEGRAELERLDALTGGQP